MQRYEEYLECANIVHKILQIVPFGERIAKYYDNTSLFFN